VGQLASARSDSVPKCGWPFTRAADGHDVTLDSSTTSITLS
jgi:hypothetical protein